MSYQGILRVDTTVGAPGLAAGRQHIMDLLGDSSALGLTSLVGVQTFAAQTRPVGGRATSGDDNLSGTSGIDTIRGLAGNDTINGLAGNDTLYGDDGNDKVIGGAGADKIQGGGGDDQLYSDVASGMDRGTMVDSIIGGDGSDTIYCGYGDSVDGGTNGNVGDTLYISFAGATSGINFNGHLAAQTIGGGAITGIENIGSVEGSNYNDYIDVGTNILSGYSPFTTVYGMGGDDTLIAGYYTGSMDGGDGNDIVDGRNSQYVHEIDGGAGDDTIYAPETENFAVANGGDGNDTIYSNFEAHGGAGNDTIFLNFGYYGITATGDGGDDVITGSATRDNIQGNDGNDTLNANGGDDTVDGGVGTDIIRGGAGSDTLIGGAGNDTFLYTQSDGQDIITDFTSGDVVQIQGYASAKSITQTGSSVVVVFSSADQITFENTDVATVQAGLHIAPPTDDTLTGGSGSDQLSGYGGNDTIYGNDGDDIIAGGTGADLIDGGAGDDRIYSGDVSPPYDYPSYGYVNTPPLLDRSTEVDTILAGAGDDWIFAGYGDNVDGGANSYYGDTLFISFQGASSGVTYDASLGTQVIGGGTITGIENIGWIEGSNFDDYINVNPFNGSGSSETIIEGMGGNDSLIAGYYTRVMDGGDGNDIVDGRNSQYLQQAIGGAGNDTIYVNAGALAYGGDGNDTIYSGGQAHGGNGDDTIILSPGYGVGSGAFGDAGNDQITGSSEADYLDGGDGADILRGGRGDDGIDGGDGADIISGDLGNDTLTGGTGNDIFVFGQTDGQDTITDFTSGDIVQINGYTSAQSVTQNDSDVVVVFSGGDQITFQNTSVATVQAGLKFIPSTNDTLVGGPGDDYLRGYGGKDTISGNDGNDTLSGGAGADTISGGAGDDIIYSGDIAPSPWDLSNPPVLDRGTAVDTITGGTGSDTIFAGYGDKVDGGANGDQGDALYISFQGATAGVHFDAHLASQTIGGGAITGIENIGWVEGSNYGDYIDAGSDASNDYSPYTQVYGMGGNDTLIAGAHTGVLDGGDGNDIVDARNSLNIVSVSGGAGDDTIYTNANSYGSFPGNPVAVDGGDGNDTIYANGAIHGGAGDDIIHVLDSNYSGPVAGDGGNDTIYGSSNADQLDGGTGNDIIEGGAGDDAITGGSGSDVLTGGVGNDRFDVGYGNDVITDFSAGDSLKIHAGFSASSMHQVGSDVVIALDTGDTLTFKNSDLASVENALKSVPVNDMAISADAATIYVAADDGNLYSYDAVTGHLIRALHVGQELGGMDISPDGSFAIVTELQPVESHPDPDGYPTYTMAVYKVDLATGAITTFEYLGQSYIEYTFSDAAILSDGTVLLAEQMPPGWSGGVAGQLLDLQTGQFSPAPGGGGQGTVLSDSPDGTTVLLSGEGSSDAPLYVYQAGAGIVASHEYYADNVYGPNTGVQAYDAQAGLIAQGVGQQINIYNGQLQYKLDLAQLHPELGMATAGLAFDSTGQYLFVLNPDNDSIYAVSTSDWSVVGKISVGADVIASGPNFGDRLLVAPDMSYFVVQTGQGGFVKADGTQTINGTSGNDTLNDTWINDALNGFDGNDTINGVSGNDTLNGGAGDDTLTGGRGKDTLTGGSGNDTFKFGSGDGIDIITDFAAGDIAKIDDYSSAQSLTQVGSDVLVILSANDQITFLNSTVATVQAGLQFNVQPPLNLVGTAGNDTLTGGAGADQLSGLAGNDILNGGAGNDKMIGGAGNDTYYVDSSGDVVTEVSAQGTDTVQSVISYTLSANVENGVLKGAAAIDLTGNNLANNLQGNSADNVLNGMAGNDTLVGGGGNDTLRGGLGVDVLTGGTGTDVFVFEANSGNDRVTDYQSGVDKLDFHLLGITSSDVKATLNHGNMLINVDSNHDGRVDFSITLTGVSHVDASDYIF